MRQTKSNESGARVPHGQLKDRARWNWLAAIMLVLPIVSMPWIILAAFDSWRNNNNDLMAWADDELSVKKQFQVFADQFGRPEFLVLSWEGCSVESQELQQLARVLASDVHEGWFENVADSNTILAELSDIPNGLTNRAIRKQLQGVLFGADGKQACVVLEFGPLGRNQRPQALDRIELAAQQVGIDSQQLKVGGIAAELAWLDFESVAAPARLCPLIAILMAILSAIFVRSVKLGLFVTFLGVLTGLLSAALIHWCGVQSNAVLATLPTLGGLLAISLSLHLVGYHRNAARLNSDPQLVMKQALRWAWKPTLISAVTTSLGLASLMLSRTLTIQQFGLFGAIITLVAGCLAMTLLPAFLWLTNGCTQSFGVTSSSQRWTTWATIIDSRASLLVIGIGTCTVIVATGLPGLSTSVQMENMFAKRHQVIQDSRWLEQHLGPMSSLEVVIRIAPYSGSNPRDDNLDAVECVDIIQRVAVGLRRTDAFPSVISGATGVPEIKSMGGLRGTVNRSQVRRWLDGNKKQLEAAGFFAESDSQSHWRLSVRVPALGDKLPVELSQNINQSINATLQSYERSRSNHKYAIDHYVTGLPLLYGQIEMQFIEDLLITYLSGLGLITLTVFFVLRSPVEAAIAMIPNVLPAIGVLGGLSLFSVKLDVGSVMTASIALGVAVDDTLHFVLWYQERRKQGDASRAAVQSAITHCGEPIVQTSIVCGLGLAVLGFASFLPTMRFGILIAMMLGVALVGDLILLPAILLLRRSGDPS